MSTMSLRSYQPSVNSKSPFEQTVGDGYGPSARNWTTNELNHLKITFEDDQDELVRDKWRAANSAFSIQIKNEMSMPWSEIEKYAGKINC